MSIDLAIEEHFIITLFKLYFVEGSEKEARRAVGDDKRETNENYCEDREKNIHQCTIE